MDPQPGGRSAVWKETSTLSEYARKLAGRVVSVSRRVATGDSETILEVTYRALLQRPPDDYARRDYLPMLQRGELSVEQLGRRLVESEEFKRLSRSADLGMSLHSSRCDFVKGLPKAKRILDLGGTNLLHEFGAMVIMGYPYVFEELVIVDLPPDERHPIYNKGGTHNVVETYMGPVRYEYHSMADLSQYESGYFDLVYSGQTIEHIELEEAESMLKEIVRVLRPGGWFGVDTPNARLTRLQQDDFIDPDHKYEFTVKELRDMLESSGLRVLEEKGLNYGGESLDEGVFSPDRIAQRGGIYADAESCYLMAFVSQKP